MLKHIWVAWIPARIYTRSVFTDTLEYSGCPLHIKNRAC